MTITEIIIKMNQACSYSRGVEVGIELMIVHHGWTREDWTVNYDDIASEFRLLKTTLFNIDKLNDARMKRAMK